MSDDHSTTPQCAGPPHASRRWKHCSRRKAWSIRPRLDQIVDTYETRSVRATARASSPKRGRDPEFRQRLLADATAAFAELGIAGPEGGHLVAVENTARVHNLVVCTLCSCYPWPVLGLPPVWYKSFAYRSRAVSDPRGVLRDFGLELPDEVEVRVWDSSAEIRYLVIPQRPAGTEKMSEDELAAIVTRDSMVGVAQGRRTRAQR